ncbi:MAG: TonB-dependent receptor plug domain-containing protein [Candidatus Marinarcus sp.]|uniref:TonB-dependent receptor plug domain-containing protein n=1 Tax=Candidatus Marinarcus sp. TaxID=3100987 RepID=UPI003B005E41
MKILLLFCLLFSTLFSDTLESLLNEYETTTENSLQTVDEKLGHVFIYSQKEIRLMQYNKLSDILKELPLFTLNKNRYGVSNPSVAGSKTMVSGFFRFFINDHEISSVHTKSPFINWGDLPLDFIDHVEIYYGESSFALGNDSGIYFIRLYTKEATKVNGGKVTSTLSNEGSNSFGVTYSSLLVNDWSYLIYLNKTKTEDESYYKNKKLYNSGERRYLFLDVKNDSTNINFGYTDLTKDNYMGLSKDVAPDDGEITSKDYFLTVSKYFSQDNSVKGIVSIEQNKRKYSETNSEKIALIPFGFSAYNNITQFNEDLEFTKINAYLSKTFQYGKNTLLTALSFENKKYDVKSRSIVNSGTFINVGAYNDFDKESVRSLLLQDDYKVADDLILIGNAKIDQYKRSGFLKDTTTQLYRVGTIYTPLENFGLKSFYTQTTVPQHFYNIDFALPTNKNLKEQKYEFYTIEAVFATDKSKIGLTYDHVNIKDFIYLAPVGFVNVDHTIKTDGLILDYEYTFSSQDKFHLNYYVSTLSEAANNSKKGGYLKYMGEYGQFEYFSSLIYKSDYSYNDLKISAAYDFSLGTTYHITKNLSVSLKGENLFDKSTQSLFIDASTNSDFAFDDYGRNVNMTLKWLF